MFNDIILDQISLANKKLISCDIFDTLIFRKLVDPTDIFEEVAKVAIKKEVLGKHILPIFKQLRIEAQRIARNRKEKSEGHREVTLYEIYAEFPETFPVKELSQIEFEIEKESIYLNNRVYQFLKYCHTNQIKVVLLSDMYLSSKQIKEILLNAGADLSIFEEIIVSSEYNKSKYEKELYNVLIHKYSDIVPKDMIHIGDNYHSDYLNALSFGIQAYHYKLSEIREEKFKLEAVNREQCIEELFSFRKQMSFHNKYDTEKESFWYDFGTTVLGPVLTNFTEYIISTAKNMGIKDIYPIMRDGYIFQKLLETHVEITGENFNIKPLYTSRLSTYLGSIEEFDDEVLESLIYNSVLTVGGLFNRLQLEDHPFKKYNHQTFSSMKTIIFRNNKTVYDAIIDYILNPKIKKQINNTIDINRKLLIEYIQQIVNMSNKIMTVDIGYNGTVNNSIEKAFRLEEKTLNAVHLVMIGGVSLYKKLLNGLDIRSYINYYNHRDFLKSNFYTSLLLDTLMQDDEGSVVGYEKNENDQVIPILDSNYIESINSKDRKICQQGIIDYYRKYIEFKKRVNIDSAGDKSLKTMWIIERFMKYPTSQEAKFLGELYTENNFNFQDQQKLCPASEEQLARELGAEKYLIKKRRKINVWPSGVVERVFPYYLSIQLYKQSTDNNTMVMSHIAELFIKNGIKECIIYGAGEMGKSLLNMFQLCGIKVHYLVDRNESLWGSMIEGIEIVSFEQSKKIPCNVYAIASHAFVDEIHQFIKENYIKDKEVKIIDYLDIYKYINGVRID